MGDQPVTKDWQNNVQLDVADEMARQAYIHGNKLTTPPKKLSMSNGSVDLTQFKGLDGVHTAYDRYQELIAQPKPGMPTLRQALQKVIVDPRYQDKLTDGEFGNDSKEGTRIMQLHRVIGMYRQAASKVLMQENPEIVTALKQDIYRASVAKRAKKTPDQQASATDTLLNGAQ